MSGVEFMTMEVVNSRTALLSNFEVFTLLRELESDNLARTKASFRIKKEEEANGGPSPLSGNNPVLEASENLRTVEVEAIQYLSADFMPTSSQTEEGIARLVKALSPYDLTKAEKLQIVNLAPTLLVELYAIVEELEDRFGDKMDEILNHVKESLSSSSSKTVSTVAEDFSTDVAHQGQWEDAGEPFADAQDEEILYDDTGEGAGVQGDLDMDDD